MSKQTRKTCKKCYAAQTGSHPLQGNPYGCELGYKTDGNGKALEDCPKPKSWRQLEKMKEVL